MKAIHISWDVDNEAELKSLPAEVEIPNGMTDEEEISDYLSALTGFCHRGFSLSTDQPAGSKGFDDCGRESRSDRFRRVAEARVNKIIKMIRLLGNCSNSNCYAFTSEQVQQIFTALQTELDRAKERFSQPAKKRFSLSGTEQEETSAVKHPTIVLMLPDGTSLRAVATEDDTYPAINVYWDSKQAGEHRQICFAEYNPEKEVGLEVCIGAYQSDLDDTVYYRPYMAEGESNEEY